MSKTITVPGDRGSRVCVTLNGRRRVYAAGETVSVSDEVAALLADSEAERQGGARVSALDESLSGISGNLSSVSGSMTALEDRVTALDRAETGEVPALKTRVAALDTAGTGEIDKLKARVTALEPAGE